MRNQLYETTLARQGVGFAYLEAVPLEEIDTLKGLRNQARLLEPLDKELIEEYATAMRAGSQFPPLVLWRPGKGRYVPCDGNQRLAAYGRVGASQVDAYVLDTRDSLVADRISWSFNNQVNGKRLTREECLQHAISFVRKYGMEAKEAAREWGIPYWQVKKKLQAVELRETLDRNQVKTTPSFTEDKIYRLAPLANLGEDIFCKAASVVSTAGIPSEDIGQLTLEVRKARTSEAKLAAIDKFAQSERVQATRATTKGGTVKVRTPLPREQLVRQLKALLRLLENYPAPGLKPAGGKPFKEAREEARQVCNKLIDLFGLGALLREEAV